jgi:hypothetical protein
LTKEIAQIHKLTTGLLPFSIQMRKRKPQEMSVHSVADEPTHRAGRKRCLEGCRRKDTGEIVAASWAVGVLASMAGGRGDNGGGRTAAAMLPILHHGEEVKVAVGDF